jgi:hypothetical protein
MKMLDKLENNLNDILEKYHNGTDEITVEKKNLPKGKRINKTILLEASMCEEVEDINMVSLFILTNSVTGDDQKQEHLVFRRQQGEVCWNQNGRTGEHRMPSGQS